ncbi:MULTISPECIES: copper resistance system multicopper oxidase [unclassified Sphingomonas]|uniref:copper resistance system multicopper oxidase n=1 Tax=unclassified Sphingomonas TaxID=196159 RepID=UPI0006FDF779|nr:MULTISPECIES: copper resistance system multicopper oxidase [unclassified Sphingomonas]KQX24863.1 copper-binding protein [Sphingomonas sp. Root1294]KQY69851.1 copper-binding protein [Sphingomonas sp. Root50]KRB93966.1 copper-binding protein [Sphingomonas sp. Root720]
MNRSWNRRALLRAAMVGATAAGLGRMWPAWAQSGTTGIAAPLPEETGGDIHLRIGHRMMRIDGRDRHAIGINGGAPAPILRLREGQSVRIRVDNELDEETSLHWHGLILPFQMDGVPGISFPGIAPRSGFTYEFPIVQAGTYWYHSHSGLQEQMGLYGPIVIDPAGPDPIASDRQHVVMLSDHSRLHPHEIFRRLKLEPGYFNRQRQTLSGLLAGRDQPPGDRLAWGGMRMDPTDISDVTGTTYDFLVNGHGPRDNWTALFRPGERVRLRLINASAMTIFNVRIPGLKLTVVQADGLNVRPVAVDELQISVAETYDVIVEPAEDRAYTIVGEAVDRSGMARATLAPRPGMVAEVPPLRRRPIADMTDMGMDMGSMDHGAHNMDMSMRNPANAPTVAMGPGVQTISPMPKDRTGEPGQGLDDAGHRVLVYRDLVAVERNPDVRAPTRSIDVHLTGNMERYMWSFDGKTLSEARDPLPIRAGERVRVNLINDTMMSHPIHLHGHFFELVTGHGDHAPRKHTVNVAPGGKVSFDVTGVEGDWAFHCHMLYHMHAGMMRVVQVRAGEEAA